MKRHRSVAGIFAAASAVSVGLGVSAPLATAGPAGLEAEIGFLTQLVRSDLNVKGAENEAVTLGYLLCALDQVGGVPPAGTEVIMRAASNHLCAALPPVQREPNVQDQIAQMQQNIQEDRNAVIEMWTDTDPDNDGVSDSDDDFDYDGGAY